MTRTRIAHSQNRAAAASTTLDLTYRAEAAEIALQIATLQAKLDAHRARQAADPTNWGYVGDLKSIRQTLTELNSCLGN